jgi:hypothetical protein
MRTKEIIIIETILSFIITPIIYILYTDWIVMLYILIGCACIPGGAVLIRWGRNKLN